MHAWAARNFLHMQARLRRISMRQHQRPCLFFCPDLNLVAAPSFSSAFINFFKRYVLVMKILSDEDRGCLNTLPSNLDPKGVVASRYRQEESCASPCQRIKYSQPTGKFLCICTREDCYVEQYLAKDLIGFPSIAPRLRHLQWYKWPELRFQWS